MRNFQLITYGVDVIPALQQLKTNEHLWNQHRLRTNHPSGTFRDVDDIWVRMNDLTKTPQSDKSDGSIHDRRESINYPAAAKLPAVRSLVMGLAARVEAERVGRVLISRLRPGGRMLEHRDIGDDLTIYYDNEPYYSRFHIVLQGLPGSLFHCAQETVNMRTSEIWSFRGDLPHSVENNSSDDRIHIVVDLRLPVL